ncbi:MAG: hypothetical protein WAV98_03355 [Minisyncoccia bacterium]
MERNLEQSKQNMPEGNKSRRIFKIFLLIIYITAFISPAFVWALALGTTYSFICLGILIIIPFVYIITDKWILKTERAREILWNIPLVLISLFLLYMIFTVAAPALWSKIAQLFS